MRISITTDDGEVLDILSDEDLGDLSKPMAQWALAERVQSAKQIIEARRERGEECS